ncbi:sensor histidine kinase [Sandaracinobacteroides sp. A072]|uniref:sensor histidine kinase n=1 Tax=Sandaracinobacteroides sp. A072 TaxID=3461146 RepID=UPI0040418FDE
MESLHRASLALAALLAFGFGALSHAADLAPYLWGPILLIVILLLYRVPVQPHVKGDAEMQPKPGRVQETGRDDGDRVSIAALADPAILASPGWRVLAANEGAQAMFGRRIVGGDLRQTVRHPVVIDAVRLGMLGESPVLREVTGLGSQDGAFRVRVAGLEDGTFLLGFTDITQTRLTERMRVDFVANASHELRTPLANISGFIETLQGPAADDAPARARFLDIMGREASRMSRLIDDLLSLSRIELDKYVRPQTMLDLAPILSDVGKTLAMRLEADGRRLDIAVAPDLPQVVADRDQILQVLHNLVSNALKYGREGTPIRLSATLEHGPAGRAADMVRISVSDEGEGIAPEHLPRLTERFYRIDTGRSRSMGGTGLGLAIVKHIVERHRGRLEIESRQGIGTTVSFLLPTMLAAQASVTATAIAGPALSQNRNGDVT